MEFRKVVCILVIAAIPLAGAGCTSSSNTSAQSNATASTSANSTAEKVTLPKDQPALVGKVKEIVGNEVTIYKAQGTLPRMRPPEGTAPSNNGNRYNSSNGYNRDNSNNGNNTGSRPAGKGPGMQFTKETETLIIPVGTPMAIAQRGGEATSISLTDIKKDQILLIWKKDGAVSFVEVMGDMGNRNSNSNQQGSNGTGQRNGYSQDWGGPPGGGGMGGMGR